TLTQNTSQALTNALGCNDGVSVYDTALFRALNLASNHGIVNDYMVSDVEFGIFFFNGAGPKTIEVSVYSTPGPFPGGTLTLRGSANRVVTSANNLTILSQPVNALIPAGEILVYKIFVAGPDGSNYLGFLGNTLGQSGPTYWQSVPCGSPNIVDFGGTFAAVMNVIGEEILPSGPISICGAGNPRPIPATGTSGLMTPSVATVSETGILGTDYTLDDVSLNLIHTWANDV